jgi:hypothetical protein
MAVLRESSPANPVSRATAPDIRQTSGGSVKQPDVRKFLKEPSTADLLLDSVVKVGSQVASQAWEVQKEEAYIDGVRQAAVVESEQDLQSSPFMSDWSTSGFRDTKGRLEQAEYAAAIPTIIAEALTKPDPKVAFQSAIAERQRKLTTTYEGMSRKARAASFAQNATDIQTSQAMFTKEYAKWGIAQEEKSLMSAFTARRSLMDESKDDQKAYAKASESFAAGVYTDIWLNGKLPQANKVELTKQALQFAASTDNVQAYNLLKERQFDFPDGTSGTVMQQLPFEDQLELDKAQRTSMARSKGIRAAAFEDTMARQRAEWSDKNGPGPTISYDQLSAQLDEAQDAGILGVGKRESVLKEYFTAAARNSPNSAMGQAYAAGDFPTVARLGGTEEDGLKAYMKANAGMPYQQQVQALLAIGNNSGMGSAFTKAGELMASTVGQLGYSEEINPEAASTAHAFILALDQAETTNPGAYTRMLGGLSPDNQNMILLMREAQRTGDIADPALAVQWARTKLKDGKGPAATAARTANAKVDAKVVQELDTTSWYELIDSNFGNEAVVRPEKGFWFENTERLATITGQSKIVLAEEHDRVNLLSPFLSDSSRRDKAMAAAAARAVETDSGPVFMPPGQNIHSYFKAPQIADKAYISRAINEILQLEPGQRVEWSTSQIQGAPMLYRVFNEDGAILPSASLDPASIGVRVKENLETDAAVAVGEIGPGKRVSGSGGAYVQFNGQNTAGFAPGSMLKLRDDIVASEGVSGAAYGDGKVVKGNKAFGVGISQTGKRFQAPLGRDGQYMQSQIDNSFMEASNDAAESASRIMRGTGLVGDEWLRFFGELAYQSPASARDTDMLAHIQLGNKDSAEAALRATNAFKNSPASRQEAYLNKLKKAMK